MKRVGSGVAALRTVMVSCTALVAVAMLAAAPARAADLPVPAPGYYPPIYPPALYNWTGLYFGGQLGGALLSDTVTQAAPGLFTLNGTTDIAAGGVTGGGQVGYNYQFSTWVLGAEASVSATNLSGSSSMLTTGPDSVRSTSAPLWFGSATGRIGYAANSLLTYVKGGVGWMKVNYTQDILAGGVTANSEALNDTRTGYTVGIGLEYGLTENFSARLEYDFYGFGTKTYAFNPAAFTPVSDRSELSVLAFGLNYRFNWASGGPLIAR